LGQIEDLIKSNPFPVFDYVIGCTAYKNRDVGIWFRSEHVVVIDAHVSDNLIGITLVQLHNLVYIFVLFFRFLLVLNFAYSSHSNIFQDIQQCDCRR
jgi:hypothetical protein